jgi:hypothetical protein
MMSAARKACLGWVALGASLVTCAPALTAATIQGPARRTPPHRTDRRTRGRRAGPGCTGWQTRCRHLRSVSGQTSLPRFRDGLWRQFSRRGGCSRSLQNHGSKPQRRARAVRHGSLQQLPPSRACPMRKRLNVGDMRASPLSKPRTMDRLVSTFVKLTARDRLANGPQPRR